MRKYANGTTVSDYKSRQQIEDALFRYGATDFSDGMITQGDRRFGLVTFMLDGRRIRKLLPLPTIEQFSADQPHRRGPKVRPEVAWRNETQRLWRAFYLDILASLESVASKIKTTEQAFYADILLPNRHTIWEETHGAVERAYLTGQVQSNFLVLGLPERASASGD